MKNASAMIKSALYYSQNLGFSVIPISRDKTPLIAWEIFQKQKASPKEIMEWYLKWPDAQVGIITGSISGFFAVDLDAMSSMPELEPYIPDSLIMPTVETPRGGRHFYFNYPKDQEIRNANSILPKVDIRGEGGFVVAPPSMNGNGKGWKWASGLKITDVAPPDPPEELLALLLSRGNSIGTNLALSFNINNSSLSLSKDILNTTGEGQESPKSSMSSDIWEYGRRDDNLFHVANCLTKTYNHPDYIIQCLRAIILSWGETNEKWIAAKIKSAMDRAVRRERNLAGDVREWVMSSSGVFLSSEVSKCLHLSSREEQKNLSKILKRMCEDENPVIKRHGSRTGCFKILDNDEEKVMDIFRADDKPLGIQFPLGVHVLVNIMPKNIAILAGESDAGKTLFLLNTALMNKDLIEVVYFSSEMGEGELKGRLRLFGVPLEQWEKVKFIERSSDFADKIRPNALNIIDFLEIHKDFHEIGMHIKDVFDRLETGAAIIAIQKNKGRDEGLGGDRSKEKARLYMAMEYGKLKIVKAKNWVDPRNNPNGQRVEFDIVENYRFVQQGYWKKE